MSDNAIELPHGHKGLAVADSVASAVLKSGDYLPYLTVTGSNAEMVKDGKIGMGLLALVVNQVPIDLGKECVVVVLAERPKAMVFGTSVLSYFDVNSTEFKAIMSKASVPNSGALAGLEFLIWIPSVGEQGTFAGLFCGNKTSKREAPAIRGYVGGKAMTLKVNLIKGPKYSWFGFVSVPCTTPIASRPDPDELAKQINDFTNPKSSLVEKAPDLGEARAR